MISGNKISCRYKKAPLILKNVSFNLRKGRITTFMGQSGAGKTTLLKCIANLQPHYEGTIICNGSDIKNLRPAERATAIGFVLQQFHLFPHLTALKNCTYALQNVLGLSEAEAEKRAADTMDSLGMHPYIHSFPCQLSGGQQQRVAIARALVLQPNILLLDEPTSALDPESKKSLESLLLELKARGITLGLSSHDMPFIRKIMDFVYFMERGELIEEWDSEADNIKNKKKISQFIGDI